MKQFKFLLAFIITVVLTSCNFTENINVQEDGTAAYCGTRSHILHGRSDGHAAAPATS